jgi:hypothetical protein
LRLLGKPLSFRVLSKTLLLPQKVINRISFGYLPEVVVQEVWRSIRNGPVILAILSVVFGYLY